MEKSLLLEAKEWAKSTFGSVRLGDKRRTQRAVAIAEAMARNPSAALPRQMGNEASLHATYRFLRTPDVRYELLIAPHLHQTREDARQKARVLMIQDTVGPWIISIIPQPEGWVPLAMGLTTVSYCRAYWRWCQRVGKS